MGNPPIYRALQRGWNEIAEFLMDHHCDVNKTTANGMTCFFAAAHCNKIHVGNIAKRLLKTGTILHRRKKLFYNQQKHCYNAKSIKKEQKKTEIYYV